MHGIWRLVTVSVVAAIACAAAIVAFQDRTAIKALGCGHGIVTQPGYVAAVQAQPNPPRAAGTDVLIDVRLGGQPLNGADVCMTTDMVGMPMGGPPNYKARPSGPGRYDTFIAFGMAGTWAGEVVVSSGGKPVLAQPVSFSVSP